MLETIRKLPSCPDHFNHFLFHLPAVPEPGVDLRARQYAEEKRDREVQAQFSSGQESASTPLEKDRDLKVNTKLDL